MKRQDIQPNTIKKALLLLVLSTGIGNAQIVAIPDIFLKGKLINASPTNDTATDINGSYVKIDTNNDQEIQVSEAEAIYSINVFNSSIIDMTGILSFPNLRYLGCDYNAIINLDVNPLTNLTGLNCRGNLLTTLDVSGLVNLTSLWCELNQLSILDVTNSPNLQVLVCQANPLTSLNITGLANLETFFCDANGLTNLDLTGLIGLVSLHCSLNALTSLDLSGSPNLSNVECDNNQLTDLDVSGLTNLETLTCSNNNLQNLDLSGLTSLVTLECTNNSLANINVSGLSNLITLKCFYNNLSSINVNDLISLQTLWCAHNQLMSLDVNNLTQLTTLIFSDNLPLVSLFLKNGVDETIYFINNPNMRYVCADESEVTLIQNDLIEAGLANVTVSNSFCSFTPGGNYNIITGNTKYDINNNGCDASDINFPDIRININDGNIPGAALTNTTGNYALYTQIGNFNITPAVENPSFFNISPATATIPFADNNNNTTIQNFCISPNGLHPDVEVVVSPIAFARPGFDATYKITYRNKGNQTFSEGIVGFQYEDSVLDFVSSSQPTFSQAVGDITWLYTNLLPFESRTITVTLNVNSPTEIPAVNIDDVLNFTVSTFPSEADENPQDNTFEYHQTVVGSYDPNDITCLEGNVVSPTEIGNYLHYAINFENTGTFPAENIVVKTEVDAAKFDIGSLQLMNANFPVDARITGNKVEFIFTNIQLPIGGHGHILLKIKTQNTLVTGDAVANRGDIFFDYNFPIDTGLANTVFQTLSNTVFEKDETVQIYPNPTTSKININCKNNIQSVELFDVQGRILQTTLENGKTSVINISDKTKGIYFIKVHTDKGIKIEKILKN